MTNHPVIYVDTSALGALLIDQPESPALLDWLDHTPATLVSSDRDGIVTAVEGTMDVA